MSTTRGIFESFPNQPGTRADSPFAAAQEPDASAVAASPFKVAAGQDSPFSVVDDASEARAVEPGQSSRAPERRKSDSPFQAAEPSEGFGFEAPAKVDAATPASPPAATSPFSAEPPRGASASTQAAIAAFGKWQETPAAAPASQATAVPQAFTDPAPAPTVQVPAAFAPAPEVTAPVDESTSDSFSIRQLELRAIFGMDREMNPEEILERSRALTGIRNLTRVSSKDMAAVESLKQLLPNLGFGGGSLKLMSGTVPLEFIREGSVMLAVQTDGAFAPGVRETLMLVARELGRLA